MHWTLEILSSAKATSTLLVLILPILILFCFDESKSLELIYKFNNLRIYNSEFWPIPWITLSDMLEFIFSTSVACSSSLLSIEIEAIIWVFEKENIELFLSNWIFIIIFTVFLIIFVNNPDPNKFFILYESLTTSYLISKCLAPTFSPSGKLKSLKYSSYFIF